MTFVQRILAAAAIVALLGAAPAKSPHKVTIPSATPDAVTHHVATVGGVRIPYTARAGTITLRNASNQITARMFYVAYIKDGADKSRRPVTFFYNGGPGSSTIWLHMGSFAPVRVEVPNAAGNRPPPFHLVNNNYSLLDKSDLVFVDAPNTGYSRVIGYGKPKDFMGVDQDGRAFTQFIQRYIGQFNRWNSPKFLFGESYGTTRDAVLGDMLQQAGVQLNGIVFQSSILNFQLGGLGGGEGIGGGDWAYVLDLPTEAATAWYHNKVPNRPRSLATFLRSAERFAGGRYMHALAQGDSLSSGERDAIVGALHQYLGVSEQYIRDSHLRIPYFRFLKELLRPSDRIMGRYDSRYMTYDIAPTADYPSWDPSDVGISGAFVGAFNRYIRDDLHYYTNLMYRPTAYGGELGARWDMHHNGQDPPANVTPDLAEAMSSNPYLQIFSANGYYDFATPYFATVYTLSHLNIAPAQQRNITYGFYQSGHMIYLNPNALPLYKRDLARWYDRAAPIR